MTGPRGRLGLRKRRILEKMRRGRKLEPRKRQLRRVLREPGVPAHLPASLLDLIPMSGPTRNSSSR